MWGYLEDAKQRHWSPCCLSHIWHCLWPAGTRQSELVLGDVKPSLISPADKYFCSVIDIPDSFSCKGHCVAVQPHLTSFHESQSLYGNTRILLQPYATLLGFRRQLCSSQKCLLSSVQWHYAPQNTTSHQACGAMTFRLYPTSCSPGLPAVLFSIVWEWVWISLIPGFLCPLCPNTAVQLLALLVSRCMHLTLLAWYSRPFPHHCTSIFDLYLILFCSSQCVWSRFGLAVSKQEAMDRKSTS